jgi:hypothetical protein
MMRSPLFKIIGAILVTLAVLAFLFHGSVASMQPQGIIHSTLPAKP